MSNAPSGQSREVFLDLLARHEAQLLGFACAIIPNFQDAEDLFQQTVLTMWQKFGEFEPGTSFIGWGCQIARYKAMNMLKARRPSLFDNDVLQLLIDTQQDEEPESRLSRRRALTKCLGKLREADRALIQSAYSGEANIKLLASEMGRTASGVYNSLARIRASLFRCIQATVAQEGMVP